MGVFWVKKHGYDKFTKTVNIDLASARCEKLSKLSEKRLSSLLLKRRRNPFVGLTFSFSSTSSSDLALGRNGHGSSKT